jgi:hypothetical protein
MTDTAQRKLVSGKTRLNKMVLPEVKVIDAKDGRIQTTLSSEVEDRDGDVIVQKGWVLDWFVKHPVLLSSHNYYSLTSQIGEWEDVKVKGKSLIGVAKYYIGEGNSEADWGYRIASKGKAAFSVGFIPLEWEEREKTERPTWAGFKFLSQELLECSHVTVPSNPAALQDMANSKLVDPDLRMIAKSLLDNYAYKGEGSCCYGDCDSPSNGVVALCADHMRMIEPENSAKTYIVPGISEKTEESNMKLDIGNGIKLDVAELLTAGKAVNIHWTPSDNGAVDMEIRIVEPAELSVIATEEKAEVEVEEKAEVEETEAEETETKVEVDTEVKAEEAEEESEEEAEEDAEEVKSEEESEEDNDEEEENKEKSLTIDEIFEASLALAFARN